MKPFLSESSMEFYAIHAIHRYAHDKSDFGMLNYVFY